MIDQEVIGVDLGGTGIKLGRFLSDGSCLEYFSIPTPEPSTPNAVIEAIAHGIIKLNRNKTAVAVGVGLPGPADVTKRVALIAINLCDWHNVAVADQLEKKTGLPCVIENDANCAGLGELWLGASKNFQNSILLTLGTGVGGAIVLDGKLFTGRIGSAGELGLITFNPQGFPCKSGNQGSLEQYTSATAIIRDTGRNPAQWGKMAEEKDISALNFWQDYGRILGAGVTSLIYVLTPEAVIIGGGVSGSAKYFLPAMEEEINRRVLFPSRDGLRIMVAKLGNRAGMIGAAKLALQYTC